LAIRQTFLALYLGYAKVQGQKCLGMRLKPTGTASCVTFIRKFPAEMKSGDMQDRCWLKSLLLPMMLLALRTEVFGLGLGIVSSSFC